MKTFDWTIFTIKIAVKAKLSVVYNAWTKESEIEKWFLKDAKYFDSNRNKIDKLSNIEKGQSYEWDWYLYDITENGKITEANGKDFLQFTFAGECLVDVKLTEHDGFVIVELTQKNIPTDEQSRQDIRLGCHTGWSFYLTNLKSIFEGGIDLRNKSIDFKGLANN